MRYIWVESREVRSVKKLLMRDIQWVGLSISRRYCSRLQNLTIGPSTIQRHVKLDVKLHVKLHINQVTNTEH